MNSPISLSLAAARFHPPHIDYASLAPFIILGVGALAVLMIGITGGPRSESVRGRVVPLATILVFAASIVDAVIRFKHPVTIIDGALRVDQFALILDGLFAVAGIACVMLSLRSRLAQRRPRRIPRAAAVQRARDGDARLLHRPRHPVPGL